MTFGLLVKIVLLMLMGSAGGFAAAVVWEYLTWKVLKLGRFAFIKSFHLHHSLFGPGAFLLVPFFWGDTNEVVLIVSFGVGILVQHAKTGEGLLVISRGKYSLNQK